MGFSKKSIFFRTYIRNPRNPPIVPEGYGILAHRFPRRARAEKKIRRRRTPSKKFENFENLNFSKIVFLSKNVRKF